jgi:membrane associated rhomboid family serine protease
MVVVVLAFVAQQFAMRFTDPEVFMDRFALSADGLTHGRVWQLLTFQFLHGGVWHLAGNLFGLWMFGRVVEAHLGSNRLLKIYFISGIAGGLLQALLGWISPRFFGDSVVGASAGVVGLLAAFAMLEPDRTIYLWLVVPLRMRQFFFLSAGIAAFFVAFPGNTHVAHAAHLGGLLAGAALIHWDLLAPKFSDGRRKFESPPRRFELVKAAFGKSENWQKPTAEVDDASPAEFISREVDPILEKISAHGIHSLTERERKILEDARAKMVKR